LAGESEESVVVEGEESGKGFFRAAEPDEVAVGGDVLVNCINGVVLMAGSDES
jgi:hypothetical protein